MAFIEKQGDVLSSLNKTISFLDNMDGFLDELADGVKSTSQSVYSTINGKYEGWYDGNPLDVTFNKENTENGKSVVASGTSLLFLEFGTGAYKKEHEAQSDFADQGIAPHGQYGQGRGKGKHWAYPSRRTGKVSIANGINAFAFMYQGFKTLDAEKVAEKIKEKIK